MVNEKMKALGETRSVIRELFEFGKILKRERGEENVFDFSLGNPSAPVPDCVNEAIENRLKDGNIHNYTSAQGDLSARAKIAEYHRNRTGIDISADNIYMTYGAASALSAVFLALNTGSCEYIAIAPFFPEYKVFTESAGGKLVAVKTKDDFSLDVDAVAAAVTEKTCCVILNSPNNPVGNVYSEKELKALAAALSIKRKQTGRTIYIVSDEPYREITYGKDVPDVMNIYDDTIICYSFSKTLSLAGERIGYVAVSPKADCTGEIYSAVCGAGRALGYVCAPSLFQRVVTDCLGKTADIAVYRRNRDLIYEIVTRCGFECVKPEGAFYLFIKCPIESGKFFEICKGEGVLVVPSESFGVNGYVRLAYCVPTDVIERSAPHFEIIAKKCGLMK
ncbi:MAG: pyridoxal phosphate-dependent aminotransferase [Clostridia bacterium]|nr:pyridoxal phosphate-dependent aminotransferase [Clostridia bacterium]